MRCGAATGPIILRAFRLARHEHEDRPQVLRSVWSSSVTYAAVSPQVVKVSNARGLLPRPSAKCNFEGYLSRIPRRTAALPRYVVAVLASPHRLCRACVLMRNRPRAHGWHGNDRKSLGSPWNCENPIYAPTATPGPLTSSSSSALLTLRDGKLARPSAAKRGGA